MNRTSASNGFNPIILIPSYNPGAKGVETLRDAANVFTPILVISDGSTDGSDREMDAFGQSLKGITLLRLPENSGKGAALLSGITWARDHGYSHVLTMDSDGQHPAARIMTLMDAAQNHPESMILGCPVFSSDAPAIRVNGRRISNWWANLETLWTGIGDSLFGFRVYPIAPLLRILENSRWMKRFDFEPEIAVRLRWAGVPAVNIQTEVRYPSKEEGGVSHFHYVRDNILLTGMHIRLLIEFILRFPVLLWNKVVL